MQQLATNHKDARFAASLSLHTFVEGHRVTLAAPLPAGHRGARNGYPRYPCLGASTREAGVECGECPRPRGQALGEAALLFKTAVVAPSLLSPALARARSQGMKGGKLECPAGILLIEARAQWRIILALLTGYLLTAVVFPDPCRSSANLERLSGLQ